MGTCAHIGKILKFNYRFLLQSILITSFSFIFFSSIFLCMKSPSLYSRFSVFEFSQIQDYLFESFKRKFWKPLIRNMHKEWGFCTKRIRVMWFAKLWQTRLMSWRLTLSRSERLRCWELYIYLKYFFRSSVNKCSTVYVQRLPIIWLGPQRQWVLSAMVDIDRLNEIVAICFSFFHNSASEQKIEFGTTKKNRSLLIKLERCQQALPNEIK